MVNYNQRKVDRDDLSLRRTKAKIHAYNSLPYISRNQKLKLMALISRREELKGLLNGSIRKVA